MNRQEKLLAIDAFEAGAVAFDDLAFLDPAELRYRPFPDAWTIHEHVVHFLESDIATFHRYRKALAQPGGAVLGYDEGVWTPALDYHSHPLAETLVLIRLLRRYMASHLRSLVDKDWTGFSYLHDSQGRVDLEDWIRTYINHVSFHRELIDRNRLLWKESSRKN